MIVIILGMHKSGTTLLAKTLHESGINMGVVDSGDYPKCKYEDPEVSRITKQLLYGSDKRHSLDLPHPLFEIEASDEIITQMKDYVIKRIKKDKINWGFKFPDVTLCYDIWRDVLPYHTAIGVKRERAGLIKHYQGQKKFNHSLDKINQVCDHYEAMMYSYGVPVVSFEDILKNGFGQVENILGIKLKDCRR